MFFVEAPEAYLNLGCKQKHACTCNKMSSSGFIIVGINKTYLRPILEKYGVWDQLQEDGGFYSNQICFVQDKLRKVR